MNDEDLGVLSSLWVDYDVNDLKDSVDLRVVKSVHNDSNLRSFSDFDNFWQADGEVLMAASELRQSGE